MEYFIQTSQHNLCCLATALEFDTHVCINNTALVNIDGVNTANRSVSRHKKFAGVINQWRNVCFTANALLLCSTDNDELK